MGWAKKAGVLCAMLILGDAVPGQAQDRVTLGWGRMLSNDALGDGKDRWQSGSYVISRVRGVEWQGVLPQTPGELAEFRVWAGVMAPENLSDPEPQDRPYAAALSLGWHTHYGWRGNEVSLGADLVFTGPQTGLSGLQDWVHDLVGMPAPTQPVDQLGDAVYPTVAAELGRSLHFGQALTLRPFVAAQAGVESWARIGADLVIGQFGQNDLLLRDPGNGQRYRAIEGTRAPGLSLVLGADFAEVFDSAFLPDDALVTLNDQQGRLRAGLHWQGDTAALFYGLTYLGPEFAQQDEGQITGQINLDVRF